MSIQILLIILSWLAFILYWGISAISVKKDIPSRGWNWWSGRVLIARFLVAFIIILFVAIRIATGTAHFTYPNWIFSRGIFTPIFTPTPILSWISAALSVSGVSFAIWARVHLGSNWSSRPAVKEHHELVTTGPYVLVRHPIYSGLILVAFATMLTGRIFGIVVFLVACIFYISRIPKEEKIMLELFPNEYPLYQARTKKLIPFVW